MLRFAPLTRVAQRVEGSVGLPQSVLQRMFDNRMFTRKGGLRTVETADGEEDAEDESSAKRMSARRRCAPHLASAVCARAFPRTHSGRADSYQQRVNERRARAWLDDLSKRHSETRQRVEAKLREHKVRTAA